MWMIYFQPMISLRLITSSIYLLLYKPELNWSYNEYVFMCYITVQRNELMYFLKGARSRFWSFFLFAVPEECISNDQNKFKSQL